jgi:hypothetical protein
LTGGHATGAPQGCASRNRVEKPDRIDPDRLQQAQAPCGAPRDLAQEGQELSQGHAAWAVYVRGGFLPPYGVAMLTARFLKIRIGS